MPDNDNNPPALKYERKKIEARRLPDGSFVFPVPTDRIPAEAVLVFGHADGENTDRMLDMVLTMPRGEVEAYAAFLARHGAIDREPTANEIDTMLQLVGNQLAEAQVEIMSMLSRFMIDRLGSGDHEAARDTTLQSIASSIAADSVKAGAVPADEADEAREAIEAAIRSWAERMTGGKEDGSDE